MPPDTPVPLNLDEHRELSRELRSAEARLRAFGSMIAEVYGPEHEATHACGQTVEWIQRLCRHLRSQAETDCGGSSVNGLYR